MKKRAAKAVGSIDLVCQVAKRYDNCDFFQNEIQTIYDSVSYGFLGNKSVRKYSGKEINNSNKHWVNEIITILIVPPPLFIIKCAVGPPFN